MQPTQVQTSRAPKIKKDQKQSMTATGGIHLPPSLRKHLKKSNLKTNSTS